MMIFCSVGTQQGFTRLTGYLSKWSISNPEYEIVAQVYDDDQKLPFSVVKNFIHEPEFSRYFDQASVIVSHAGMGNIIRSLELGKPIVIVPRESQKNEHVNDHQLDTVEGMSDLPMVYSACNYQDFDLSLKLAIKNMNLNLLSKKNSEKEKLIYSIKDFLGI